jgi:hypothetical protein
MKFVEKYSKEPINLTANETYNRTGDNAGKSDKVFAQKLEIDVGQDQKQTKYLIATHNNVPYDPKGIDSHRESKLDIKLKPVSKGTFFYYTLYLKTRNPLYMTRTQRSYINA